MIRQTVCCEIYFLEVGKEVEILVMDGSLLVLDHIIERNNSFGRRLKGHTFPLAVIGKLMTLHI